MQQDTAYIIISWFYICVTLGLVINRFYVRALRSRPNWSDALVLLAWIFDVVQACCDTALYAAGLRFDDEALLNSTMLSQSERYYYFSKINTAEEALYYVPLYCIKGAILCFLMEITPSSAFPNIRRAIYVGMVLSAFGLIITPWVFVGRGLLCAIPRTSMEGYGKRCNITGILEVVAIGYHMATDIYIYAIPFFLVRYLPRMISRSQRISTYLMFGAGFLLVCLAVPQMDYGLPDGAYSYMWNFWWSIHEINFAIGLACLPTLRVTMKQHFRKKGSRNAGRENGGRRKSSVVKVLRGELDTREVASVGYIERKCGPDLSVFSENKPSIEARNNVHSNV